MKRLFVLVLALLFSLNVDAVSYDLKSMQSRKKASKNDYMKLSGSDLREIMQSTNRGYHLFVLLSTEDSQARCPVCDNLNRLIRQLLVTMAPKKSQCSLPTFFAFLELAGNSDFYRTLGIRVVPDFAYISPSDPEISLISSTSPTEFSQFIAFISEKSGCQIASDVMQEATATEDHVLLIGSIIAAIVVLGLLATKRASLYQICTSVWSWTMVIMPMTYYFISGSMWSRIRKAPFYNGVVYFSNGVSSQFGIETRIIGCIYLVLSLLYMLVPTVVLNLKDANRKRVGALTMMTVVMVGQSLIVRAFKQKVPDYPISYLF